MPWGQGHVCLLMFVASWHSIGHIVGVQVILLDERFILRVTAGSQAAAQCLSVALLLLLLYSLPPGGEPLHRRLGKCWICSLGWFLTPWEGFRKGLKVAVRLWSARWRPGQEQSDNSQVPTLVSWGNSFSCIVSPLRERARLPNTGYHVEEAAVREPGRGAIWYFRAREQVCQVVRRVCTLLRGCRASRMKSWVCCWARPGYPTLPWLLCGREWTLPFCIVAY